MMGGAIAILHLLFAQPIQAANQSTSPPSAKTAQKVTSPIRPRVTCPTELEPLTLALLKDLPQYINRLSHQRRGSQSGKYAIMTSQPNLEPLPVVTSTPDPKQGGLYQTFFTLLERQYLTQRKVEYQSYYWVFLAQTETRGWQLAMLYTREGAYPSNDQPATPLRDATQEIPGLAIRQWLRDCQAGSVQLPSSSKEP